MSDSTTPKPLADYPPRTLETCIEVLENQYPAPTFDAPDLASENARLILAAQRGAHQVVHDLKAARRIQIQREREDEPE